MPPHYDSLIAKVIAHGATRDQAIARKESALRSCGWRRIATNLPLCAAIMRDARFRRGGADIHHLEHWLAARAAGGGDAGR